VQSQAEHAGNGATGPVFTEGPTDMVEKKFIITPKVVIDFPLNNGL
jgi:hypothetical protein